MKLSVIIPVYRVENTLARCIESVLSQSFSDWEMLLVDDGSPDNSGSICDDYAEKDPRINVIHKANGGLSSARNAGISAARGEYITFIDSDDFLGENTLSILMSRLGAHPDYDILEYPLCWHHGHSDEEVRKFGVHEYHDMRSYWLDNKAYTHAYAWNKIYVRRLFDTIRFPEDRIFEDAHTLPQMLRHARLVATTEEGMYYYTHNPHGITQNPCGKGMGDLLDAHVSQLESLGISNQLTEYFYHVLNIQIDVCDITGASPILTVPPLSLSSINALSIGAKGKTKLLLLKLLGIRHLCRIHRLTHPSRRAR